jgi:hypothetical protein
MASICLGLTADPRIFLPAPASPQRESKGSAAILTYREFDHDDFGLLAEILGLLDILDVFSVAA